LQKGEKKNEVQNMCPGELAKKKPFVHELR